MVSLEENNKKEYPIYTLPGPTHTVRYTFQIFDET